MKQQNDRERKERENEKRQMREQLERERIEKDLEIAELRNQLSRASLLTPQVNKGILSRFAVISAVLSIFDPSS
jgi:hypothetical protein